MGMINTSYIRLFDNCYSDFISSPVVPIGESRKPVLELIEKTKNIKPVLAPLSTLALFTFENANGDAHGGLHCPGQKQSHGYRSCKCNAKGDFSKDLQSFCSEPIEISKSDPFYSNKSYTNGGLKCLNFNKHTFSTDCSLREALPVNGRTHWLDLNRIYPDENVYNETGHLPDTFCGVTDYFFEDHRTASPSSACMMGLFAKFHNFCVNNAQNCDKKYKNIAEKCRQITIGLWQKIIYEDLLPLFFLDSYDTCDFNICYDCNVQAQASLEYSYICGRYPHLMIPNTFWYYKDGKKFEDLANLVTGMDRKQIDTDGLIRGMIEQPFIQALPISESVHSKYLSGNCSKRLGHSLTTMDFARGQEAGTCSAVYYTEIAAKAFGLNLTKISNFDDLEQQGLFKHEVRLAAEALYPSVNDIPSTFTLFESGHKLINSGLPLATTYIFCQEFKRLKAGDRFFYEWSLDDGNI